MQKSDHLRAVRCWLSFFIAGLILSGVTAFPLEAELHWLLLVLHTGVLRQAAEYTHLRPWITRVYDALSMTNKQYPFLRISMNPLRYKFLGLFPRFIIYSTNRGSVIMIFVRSK